MGRDVCFGAKTNKKQVVQMSNWDRPRQDRPRRTFRGSVLISVLTELYPNRFKSRILATIFARKLFREGKILSVYGSSTFEDSDQLYFWSEHDSQNPWNSIKSIPHPSYGNRNNKIIGKAEADDEKILESVKVKLDSKPVNCSILKTFIKQLEDDFPENKGHNTEESQTNLKSLSTPSQSNNRCKTSNVPSTEILTNSYIKFKDRTGFRGVTSFHMASQGRDHEVIPEEEPSLDKTEGNSLELELTPRLLDQSKNLDKPKTSELSSRRWHDGQSSYSDNEKQLMEEMKRMKEDHSEALKNYEERISDLMARMHDLRGIAEMLENAGNKSSPYGMLTGKSSLFSYLGARLEQERRQASAALGNETELPPPLPPRPGRTHKVYPNKAIVHTKVKMKALDWSRIILRDAAEGGTPLTIWHNMQEPKLDPDEAERLFLSPESSDLRSLYDDIARVRGKQKQQLVTLLDVEKSRRAVYTMKSLPCSMNDVINVVTSLETKNVNSDRFAELLELIGGGNEIEKVQFHVRRKTAASLDYPEYMLYEMSKVTHCKERMDFLRFRYRVQWHLFETEQQLKELHTACEEVSNSSALKNLLQAMLAVGNYLNGGTDNGQADGFGLDVLNRLKDIQDRDGKGNLLEFVLKLYCQCYEVEVDLGCPTKFRLPEPSNMRHAAQVSFENIHEALTNMKAEVKSTREKFLAMSSKDNTEPRDNLWATTENFMTCALEIIVDEERLLQDTRTYFKRTIAYFLMDTDKVTPHEFFQIWATFLHDCKYYWKLAHRKLGKERFELDFKHRSQMTSMFGHNYMDVFQTPVAGRMPNGTSNAKENIAHIPSQMVNGFPENHKMEKSNVAAPSHKDVPVAYKPQIDILQESHSPKQLTCEPPSSGLHKPLPKAASTTSVPSENGFSHNYENQEEAEKVAQESRSGTSQSDTLEWAGKKNEKHQFPFVSWMKREPGKRNNSDDSKSSADNHNQVSERHQNTSTTTSFARFKNSVVQKFTSSSSTTVKRTAEVAGLPDNRDTHNLQDSTLSSLPSHMPLRVVVTENEISPYVTSMGRENRHAMTRLHDSQKYATQPGGTSARDNRIIPSERRNLFDTRFTASGGKTRTGSNVSTEYAGLYHTPPFHAPVDKDGYSSPNIIVNPFEKSDINNNTTPKNANPDTNHGIVRTRAPLALGSNISISDAYATNDREPLTQTQTRHPVFEQNSIRKPDRHTQTFQQIPASVPSYSAKRVHNYENQGRLESTPAVKHRADPVTFPTNSVSSSFHVNSSSHLNTYPLSNRSTVNSISVSNSTQNTPVKDSAQHRLHEQEPGGSLDNTPVAAPRQAPAKPSRNLHLNFKDGQRNEKKIAASLDRLDRNGHSVPSISTLINRFEKKQNLLEAVNNEEKLLSSDVAKNLSMTSTPVTYKKPPGIENDENDPPPVPPRSDLSFQDNYPSDSLDSRSSRGKGRKYLPDNMNKSTFDPGSTPKYTPYTESNSNTSYLSGLGTKSNHVRQDTGLSDQDDGYRERLRKAAANSTVFERYNKHLTPQYQKQVNAVQFSTPQYNRQNSQTQSLTSSQSYSRQSSVTQTQASTQNSRTNGNTVTVINKLGSQFQNHVSPSLGDNQSQQQTTSPQQIPQPQCPKNSNQIDESHDTRPSPGSMAVVTPTVRHHGSLTFMEI